MKYFKKLVGKNIYLSPISLDDIDIYTKWLNDLDVTDGLGANSRITSVLSEKNWIDKTLDSKDIVFAIIDIKTDTILGNCGYNKIDNIRRTGNVGIFIGDKNNRGKGFGEEALKLLVGYGFDYLNLNNIDLGVFSFNEAAIKCYKKVGFKTYGVRHEVYNLKGVMYDEVFMEILEKDYRGR